MLVTCSKAFPMLESLERIDSINTTITKTGELYKENHCTPESSAFFSPENTNISYRNKFWFRTGIWRFQAAHFYWWKEDLNVSWLWSSHTTNWNVGQKWIMTVACIATGSTVYQRCLSEEKKWLGLRTKNPNVMPRELKRQKNLLGEVNSFQMRVL